MKTPANTLNPHWLKRARQNDRLGQLLQDLVPEVAFPHMQVIGIDSGILKLACDSAAWATRLRFMEPQIKRHLNAQGIECLGVRTRVLPDDAGKSPAKHPTRPQMGPASGTALEEMAKTTESAALQAALERLATRRSG